MEIAGKGGKPLQINVATFGCVISDPHPPTQEHLITHLINGFIPLTSEPEDAFPLFENRYLSSEMLEMFFFSVKINFLFSP